MRSPAAPEVDRKLTPPNRLPECSLSQEVVTHEGSQRVQDLCQAVVGHAVRGAECESARLDVDGHVKCPCCSTAQREHDTVVELGRCD